MKNKTIQTTIRFILTIILLIFVWLGKMWAIKLCITLSAIAWEVNVFLNKRSR